MYIFQLFDFYGASGMCLLWFCFFEAIVMGWIYGGSKFNENCKEMLGFKMNPWFVVSWKFCTPLVTFAIFTFSFVNYKPIKYNGIYEYPAWAIAFGWLLALSSMIAVPVYVIYAFLTTSGSFREKWTTLTRSSPTPCQASKTARSKNENP